MFRAAVRGVSGARRTPLSLMTLPYPSGCSNVELMSFCSAAGMPSREAMERRWETSAAMGTLNECSSPSIGCPVAHGSEQSLTVDCVEFAATQWQGRLKLIAVRVLQPFPGVGKTCRSLSPMMKPQGADTDIPAILAGECGVNAYVRVTIHSAY